MKKISISVFFTALAFGLIIYAFVFLTGGNNHNTRADGYAAAEDDSAGKNKTAISRRRLLSDDADSNVPGGDILHGAGDGSDGDAEMIPPIAPLSSKEMRAIIAAGVAWLKQSQDESGHFRYEYAPLPGTYSEEDLMVRQTGALYILGEVLRRDGADPYELKNPMEKAIVFFQDNSVRGTLNGYKFRCVLRRRGVCSLGGTGLALIGIIDLVGVYPELEETYSALLEDYLAFLLAMKKSGAGFSGWYYYPPGVQSSAESDFSNGEAVLSLARYYRYRPTNEVKNAIIEALDYFSAHYGQAWDYNFYLWGMAALKELSTSGFSGRYTGFARDFTDWRIAAYKNRRGSPGNKCAYIEGVISAYSALEPSISDKEKARYLEEINFWLVKSRKLQVNAGGFFTLDFGGVRRAFRAIKPERARGGFLTGHDMPRERIDFTQHCLSSYLQKLVDINGDELYTKNEL